MLTLHPFAAFAQEATEDIGEVTNKIEVENQPEKQEVQDQSEGTRVNEQDSKKGDTEKEVKSPEGDSKIEDDESIETADDEALNTTVDTETVKKEADNKDEKSEEQGAGKTAEEIDETADEDVDENIDEDMEEDDEDLIVEGLLDGTTSLDEDKGIYYLNLTVKTASANQEIGKNHFIGIPFPETVTLLEDGSDVELFDLEDGVTRFFVKLPTIEQGTKTYKIPLLGVTDEDDFYYGDEVSIIEIDGDEYEKVGIFTGEFLVDFTEMEFEYLVDTYSAIFADCPDDTQFELNVEFTIDNLTIDTMEDIIVEIELPKGISINKEDIDDSFSDVELNGNILTVYVGDLEFGETAEWDFYVAGKSTKTAKQLEGEIVTMSFYGDDGETYIDTYEVPFELITDEEAPCKPSNPSNPSKPNKPGESGSKVKPGIQIKPVHTVKPSDSSKPASTVEGTIVKIDNNNQSKVNPEQGNKLPNTATDFYNLLFVGFIIFITGMSLILFRKKVRN